MKKFFITAAVVLATLTAGAQVVTVGSLERIDGVRDSKVVLSPDGKFVVANDAKGLAQVDLATGAVRHIADGSGLYDVRISPDGSQVVYTRPEFRKHLRYISLESVSLADGSQKTIVKATRRLNAGSAFAGNSVTAVENGKTRVRSLDGTKAVQAPVASINYGHLDITVDGRTTSIDPQGRGSYLWPSISPDGKRVVYRLSGVGTFTCNLDGSDVRHIGNYMMTVWAGNDVLIGVAENEDTNQVLTAASLVAVDTANGATQTLTSPEMIATAPSASADGSRVAFITTDGAAYILNLTR